VEQGNPTELIEIGAAFVAVVIAWSARRSLAKWAREALAEIAKSSARFLADYRTELVPAGLGVGWMVATAAGAPWIAAVPLAVAGARWFWAKYRAGWLSRAWLVRRWAARPAEGDGAELLPWAVCVTAAAYSLAWDLAPHGPLALAGVAATAAWSARHARALSKSGRTRIARRLRHDRWREQMEHYKLSGLKRGRVVRTASGWSIHCHLIKGMTAAQAERALHSIETALGARHGAARIERKAHSDRVIVHLTVGDGVGVAVPWPGRTAASLAEPVVLGPTRHGVPQAVNARQHLLIAGRSGSGKSVLLRPLLAAVVIAADARLIIIDLKRGVEAGLWKDHAEIGTTPEEVETSITWLRGEMNRRLDLLASKGLDTWEPTPADPEIVYHVDEAAEFFRVVKALGGSVMADFTALAEQARAAGIRLWLATQYPGSKVIPTEISANLTGTIGLRVRRSSESDVIFGRGAVKEGWHAHRLAGKGWFLISDDDHEAPEPARAFWTDKAIVKALKTATAPAGAPVEVPAARPAAAESAPAAVLTLDPVEQLRELIGAAGADGIEVFSLATTLGKSPAWTYNKLNPLVASGEVTKVTRGLYALVSNLPAVEDEAQRASA
jgi:S-DNA-T family DNA segregation ATPase FtsK/SpoIIIE